MRVQLLYFDGCPNWRLLEQRLDDLAIEAGIEVERVLIETDEEARSMGFHGSPSLLLDGRDPFAPEGAPVGLTCRVYSASSGLEGSPSVSQLREVLGLPAL
ncbi:thioredoxin family protein [Tessaracoccus sp. Z1128]